jgi:molybdopterin-guanine dinucleotide biosynthesis protein
LIRHIVSRLTAEKAHVAVVKISNQSITDTEGKATYLYVRREQNGGISHPQ